MPRHRLGGTHLTTTHREPDADTLARNADQLGPLLSYVTRMIRRHHGIDYAGSTSGGAIDATTGLRAESRPPGRTPPGDPYRWEQALEATGDPEARLKIVREATGELNRLRATSKPARPVATSEYRVKPSGRPRTSASGQVLKRAAEASGLTAEDLRATVEQGSPHHALVMSALAELDGGATIASVARELGVCERTLRRWRKRVSG